MLNTAGRRRAQRGHLEAVRDDRAEQPDRGAEREDPRVEQGAAADGDRGRREQQGGDHAGDRQPVEARPAPSGLRAQQDVRRPRGAGEQREQDARQRSGRSRSNPSSADPDPGQRHPDQVAGAARPDHRDGQRPDELDGDRDARAGSGRTTGRSPSSSGRGWRRSATTTSQSWRLRAAQRRPGDREQHQALVTSRSHTIAVGSISSKRSLAIAAPNCTERIPTSTSQMARRMTSPSSVDRNSLRGAWHRRPAADESVRVDRSPHRATGGSPPARGETEGERRGRQQCRRGHVLMVGTRKGLWIGTSDDRRERLGVHRPALRHGGGLLLHDRHPRRPAAAARRAPPRAGSARRSGAPTTSARPGRRRPNGAVRFPEGTDATRRAGLAAGARRRGRRRLRRHRARRGLPLRPTAARRSRSSEALWDHPHRPQWNAGFGGQAFHTILPHPTDPRSVTAALSTGGVYQTNDGGESWEPRNQGIRAEFLPEGAAVPRVRPVRAQGRPAPGRARAAVPAEPRRRLPLRRRRRPAGSRSPTGCPPSSASRSWCTRTSRTPSSSSRSTAATAATRRTPRRGSGARATPARPGRSCGDGLPDSFFVGVMRDAMCADHHDPAGHLLRRAATARVWGSADEGETWRADGQRPARRDGGAGRAPISTPARIDRDEQDARRRSSRIVMGGFAVSRSTIQAPTRHGSTR